MMSENFDAWFSFGKGEFYLELIFVLEFIETINQVIQIFVFGSISKVYLSAKTLGIVNSPTNKVNLNA